MNKPLTVYKASAGSGKTFTLAVEYIKLLVRNPQSFRSILAVTFTNKATEEMKMRILSQLYGIWKQLPDSQAYTDRICHELDMEPAAVSRRAGTALRLLIHNYGYFRIETIDSFFQTVLRNLARELDLTANLRVELNDSQVEEHAVDKLIEELDTKNEILKLIIEYINDKIDDDKSWNVIGQIKSFGKTIFRDFYKEESRVMAEKTGDAALMKAYVARLHREMDEAKERMEEIADEFFDVLASEGLSVDDLAYKSGGVAGLFVKMKNGTFDESIVGKRVTDCLDDPAKWYSAKSPRRDAIHALALGSLADLLHTAVEERKRQWRRYKSAELTLRHLYQLRLLGSIETKVREMNEEANRFLLSDTQQLLHSLIGNSDSPFIFEKIGTRLEHVMIDEFQDTSSVQWRNFKVLLMECMSHEDTSNLIVGDVKQSIYRWRSGDWRLLNNIKGQFGGNDNTLDVKSLTMNYRSSGNIINFNNTFFECAVEAECNAEGISPEQAGLLRSAYADVAQQVPGNRDGSGYVNVRLLSDDNYEQTVLNHVADTVRMLLDNGAEAGDIAILVRTNRYIPIIAKHITEQLPGIRIVSDEAFRLDASLAVCTIVQALHLLTHRDDILTRVSLIKTYQLHIEGRYITEQDITRNGVDNSLLPKEYTEHMDSLMAMPLYDLAERLYTIFRLKCLDRQSAYVCAFYDQLSSFTQDHTADIDSFVTEWERTICGKTIQSDEPDGIRLISIHKSKGLEFDSVIIPFCDWQLEKQTGNVLWCKPTEAPFDELPIVPVDYSRRGMAGTIYEKDYMDEYLQNCVDNLNLLYVAFTRAAHNLFVIGRSNAKNSRSQIIETCLPAIAHRLGTVPDGYDDDNENGDSNGDGNIIFEYGTLAAKKCKEKATGKSDNVFTQPVNPIPIIIETFDNKTEFMQSNQSRDFISGDDADNDRREYVKMGNILHKVFSEIRTADDADTALMRLETEGLLDRKTAEKAAEMLRKRLASPQVADWFSGRRQLFNECSILATDETGGVMERRPDRVMTDGEHMVVVDFKFGTPKDSYHEQVREYMRLLAAMGYKHVEGYLWYVYSNKIERVE